MPAIRLLAAAALAASAAVALAPVASAGPAAGIPSPPQINLIEDPLDISGDMPHDYRNWASVLSQVLLKKEGSEEGAADALGRVMLAAHGHLAKVANGEELFPRFHLTDPIFAGEGPDGGLKGAVEDLAGHLAGKAKGKLGKGTTMEVTKFASASTFFNYAPCVLAETPTAVSASVTGLNFAPNMLNFAPTGFAGALQGLNIAPQVIWVGPIGAQVNPQGLNVQPLLLYFGPIGVNVQPQGVNFQAAHLGIAPVGKAIQPQGYLYSPAKLIYAPTKVSYNPQKGPVYAPVGDDLTTEDDNIGASEGGGARTAGGGL